MTSAERGPNFYVDSALRDRIPRGEVTAIIVPGYPEVPVVGENLVLGSKENPGWRVNAKICFIRFCRLHALTQVELAFARIGTHGVLMSKLRRDAPEINQNSSVTLIRFEV